LHKSFVRLLVVVASVALAACGERLEGGAACPLLCSGQSLTLVETTIDGVVLDTTLTGFPPRGSATFLMIANSGDTLESRYVVRFDSLTSTYVKDAEILPITSIDSASVRISIETELSTFTDAVTFEAYDVDAEFEDSSTAALLTLFTPARMLGSVTVDSADLKDSVRIFLDTTSVREKLQTNARLRVGIRVRSAEPARVAVLSANTSSFPRFSFDPARDDPAVVIQSIVPRSRTPFTDPRIAENFTDFNVPFGGAPLPPGVVGIGGPHGRRIYLRFNLPASITDSATVVRATLLLHQRAAPNYGFLTDSLVVAPQVVVATSEVTDLSKAALLTDTLPGGIPPSVFGLPAIRIRPDASVERAFDIVSVVRFWRSTSAARVPQAIVLRSAEEATSILEAQFYSSEADPALRPRLRLTYLPRREFGLP
jgi:hypothetical protein